MYIAATATSHTTFNSLLIVEWCCCAININPASAVQHIHTSIYIYTYNNIFCVLQIVYKKAGGNWGNFGSMRICLLGYYSDVAVWGCGFRILG